MAEEGNSRGWGGKSAEVGTAEERRIPCCKLTQPQKLCLDSVTGTRKEVPAGGEGSGV